jgi:peptidoglycan/xylan/chitin deacetylase (PgdA/CDA1 family)
MLGALAKIAAQLDVDSAANRVIETLYTNTREANRRLARRFQILAFHKVSPDPHPFFEPVHPDIFDQQMEFLSRHYRVMPLMELVERNRIGDVPDRAVAITFDDGYRDNYDFAFPILRKYRLPATIFVSTGVIETGELLWHDRIFNSFRFATVKNGLSLQPTLAKAKQLYGEGRRRFVEEIEESLRPVVDETAMTRMLTWQQIREMNNGGIDFGSHTVTHPVLSRVPPGELAKELRESKTEISERLRCPVLSFAYPNGHTGDYNDDVKRALRESGYICGLTSEFGFNHVFSDPFELRRGQPSQKRIEVFRLAFFLQRHGLN